MVISILKMVIIMEYRKKDMKEIFYWNEGVGCLATDRITVDGEKVVYIL